jgi:DNA-binding NarL/FixJ family response regulator
VASKLLDRFSELSRRTPAGEELSGREVEILCLMAEGAANKEISAKLNIAQSTVKTHITNIFQKLGVNDRTEAVTQALKKGIIRL